MSLQDLLGDGMDEEITEEKEDLEYQNPLFLSLIHI